MVCFRNPMYAQQLRAFQGIQIQCFILCKQVITPSVGNKYTALNITDLFLIYLLISSFGFLFFSICFCWLFNVIVCLFDLFCCCLLLEKKNKKLKLTTSDFVHLDSYLDLTSSKVWASLISSKISTSTLIMRSEHQDERCKTCTFDISYFYCKGFTSTRTGLRCVNYRRKQKETRQFAKHVRELTVIKNKSNLCD